MPAGCVARCLALSTSSDTMTAMKRLVAAIVTTVIISAAVVACSDRAACASILDKGSSGGGSSSGGAKSGGASGAKTGGPPSGGASKSSSQSGASSASKPSSKPSSSDINNARSSAPSRVTRNGSYYSPVTGDTYIYQPIGHYRSPGYVVNIYDPYNPYNYWYWHTSPFYGRPYRYAEECSGPEKEVQKQEVHITVDSDGKVTDVKDSPGTTR